MRNDRRNKALIGVFVIGAISILLIILLIVGSGGFYKKNTSFALYFDNSLTGLVVGSPVLFKGVKIGQVKSIRVEGSVDLLQFKTPVFIEIDNTLFGSGDSEEYDREIKFFEALIVKGMQAKLSTLSLVTGQLCVELDFYPERAKNVTVNYYDSETLIIPSAPSVFDQFMARFNSLPIEEIANKIVLTLDNINAFVNSDGTALTKSFEELTGALSKLTMDLQAQIVGIAPMMDSANKLLVSAEKNMNKVGTDLEQSLSIINNSLINLDKAIQSTTKLMENGQNILADDSPVLIELSRALNDLSSAANSVKEFTELLNREPNALLFGKGAQ